MLYLKPARFGGAMLLLACLCIGAVAGAYGQNCQVQLSQTTLDYGTLSRAAILEKQGAAPGTSLGARELTLNVLCQQPTALALVVRGAAEQENFKLGDGGEFSMRLSDALLDGKPVNLRVSRTASKLAAESGVAVAVIPGATIELIAGGQPGRGKILSLQVHVDPKVTDAASRIRTRTTWQGNVIFTVVER